MARTVNAAGLACLALCLAGAPVAHASEALADPTRPSSTAAAPENEGDGIRVEAVILRARSCLAIVNGHVVRAGDHLGNTLIEAVTAEGVRYSQHGRSAFARLTPAGIAVRHALLLGNQP
jgi:nucleoid-associated protein YgaU